MKAAGVKSGKTTLSTCTGAGDSVENIGAHTDEIDNQRSAGAVVTARLVPGGGLL